MKKNGINPVDELNKSETEKSLPEEELEKVAGGRGQYIRTETTFTRYGSSIVTYTKACDFAPDDETFMAFMDQKIDCPDYAWKGRGASARWCMNCAHFQNSRSKFKPRLESEIERY